MIVPADFDNIQKASIAIKRGELVAFPTETVYGLGADATNGMAVARIYEVKQRPSFNPLIVHVKDVDDAALFARMNKTAALLAERFWPGPLTLVLPLRDSISSSITPLATAGLETVALRVPDHPVALNLLRQTGTPLAAPSANVSGHVSPTTAHHVFDDFGASIPFILDGGATLLGLESTIVSAVDTLVLLRSGTITKTEISNVLGRELPISGQEKIIAPGQLQSHYAPRAPLRMNAMFAQDEEVFLAFGPNFPQEAFNLSTTGNLKEAAANLFAFLRTLDRLRPKGIAVSPIPNIGIGEAINDRLRRAAAPRFVPS